MLGLAAIDFRTRGFGAKELVFVTGFAHCLSADTEALTPAGWRPHSELTVGTPIWTLRADGVSEWAHVEAVNVFDYSGPTHQASSRSVSFIATPGHKWPAFTQHDPTLILRESAQLNTSHSVPKARVADDGDGIHADALVELIGWVVTEGTYPKRGFGVAIYQSLTANPEKCEGIRECLRSLVGDRWNEGRNKGCMVASFAWDLGRKVRSLLPDKVLTKGFVDSLTQPQRLLLIDTMIKADGTTANALGTRRYMSSREDGFAHLLASAGIAFSQRQRKQTTQYGTVTMNIYTLITTANNFRWCRSGATETFYSGVMWCPTTKNGTWFARRNGTTYYTGNSGKTQLLNTALLNNRDKRVLFFSMDDPAEMILIKLVCMLHNVDAEQLEARIREHDHESKLALRQAATHVFQNLSIVDDSLGLSGMDIALKEFNALHSGPPHAVIVDFIGSMQGGGDGEDNGIKRKAADLKQWVKDKPFPTIVATQNTRSRGAPGEPISMLSMGYGGEQEATMVIGVRRKRDHEGLERGIRDLHKNTVTLHLVKNKRPPGKLTPIDGVDLFMEPATGLIRPMADNDWPSKSEGLRTAAEAVAART